MKEREREAAYETTRFFVEIRRRNILQLGYFGIKMKDKDMFLEKERKKIHTRVMLKRIGTESEGHPRRRLYLDYLTSRIQ